MPTYFLHLHDGADRFDDPQGTSFVSLAAARAEAERAAREMMAENLREGRPLDHQEIHIADAQGRVLEVVRFSDVLRQAGGID